MQKKYESPSIEEVKVEISDICAESFGETLPGDTEVNWPFGKMVDWR